MYKRQADDDYDDDGADGADVQEKYEWWWMYMCDAKRKMLLAPPMQICTLGDRDEVLASLDIIPFSQWNIVLKSSAFYYTCAPSVTWWAGPGEIESYLDN